jgi:hypothetical protein
MISNMLHIGSSEVQLEREALRKVAFEIDDVACTKLHDVFDLVLERREGADLRAEGDGEMIA